MLLIGMGGSLPRQRESPIMKTAPCWRTAPDPSGGAKHAYCARSTRKRSFLTPGAASLCRGLSTPTPPYLQRLCPGLSVKGYSPRNFSRNPGGPLVEARQSSDLGGLLLQRPLPPTLTASKTASPRFLTTMQAMERSREACLRFPARPASSVCHLPVLRGVGPGRQGKNAAGGGGKRRLSEGMQRGTRCKRA
jgi:hypothetical protein